MKRIKSCGVFICVFFLAVEAIAQLATTTSLVGTVVDSSGAVVPNVEMVAVNVGTQDTYRTTTNLDGDYTFPYIREGTYTVKASGKGFEAATHTDVVVEMNHTVRVDFTLQVGAVTQTVNVTGGAPPIATDEASIRQTLSSVQITDLPLNGRNAEMLATTIPGVLLGFKSSAAADPGPDFIGAGTREVENDITLDGVSLMNNLISKSQFPPSVDSISEVQVQTGTYPAQYGGYMGVHINMVSKNGTNMLHGTAYEFVRNDAFDAYGFFENPNQPKLPFHRNQFGAELGGPVVIPKLYNGKNKTFFMISYEGMRQVQSTAGLTTTQTVPMRMGDFSAISTPIHDPLLPGNPTFAGNVIPAADQSPQALVLQNFIPLPNLPGITNNYRYSLQSNDFWDQTIDRVDENLGERTRLFFRLAYVTDSPLYGTANPYGVQPAPNHDNNVVLGYTQIISPTMVNDLRLAHQVPVVVSSNYFFSNPAAETLAATVGIPGFAPSNTNPGIPSISISGYVGTASGVPSTTYDETWEGDDTFSYFHGTHSIVAGFDLDKFHISREAVNLALGSFSFTGALSGFAPADFLLGLPLSDSTPEPYAVGDFHQWRDGFFVQDKWDATRKLTLNVGLRYDLPTALTTVNGVATLLNSPENTQLIPSHPPEPGYTLVVPDHTNFGPRFGFAYRITDKWVARGGFGIYYNPNHMNDFTLLELNPPFSPAFNYQNTNLLAPTVTLSDPTPSTSAAPAPPTNVITIYPQRGMPTSSMNQWSFDVERALWHNAGLDVQYLGNHADHLDTSWYNNTPMPGPGPIQARRPNQLWGTIRTITNIEYSNYDALNVVLTQRMSHGATLLVSYTWSHDLDESSDSNNGAVMNPYDLQEDYGNANWDVRQRFVMDYNYVLPFFKQSRNAFVRNSLGGWQLNGIITLQTGFPFSVAVASDIANTGTSGTERASLIGSASTSCHSGHLADCIQGDFMNPAQYTYGNTARNLLFGPGLNDFDVGLFKNISIKERGTLQIRGEFFNFFNTPSFSSPNATFGTSSFGTVTSTSNNNRQIQLALKLIF